jgi:hypothetical protein
MHSARCLWRRLFLSALAFGAETAFSLDPTGSFVEASAGIYQRSRTVQLPKGAAVDRVDSLEIVPIDDIAAFVGLTIASPDADRHGSDMAAIAILAQNELIYDNNAERQEDRCILRLSRQAGQVVLAVDAAKYPGCKAGIRGTLDGGTFSRTRAKPRKLAQLQNLEAFAKAWSRYALDMGLGFDKALATFKGSPLRDTHRVEGPVTVDFFALPNTHWSDFSMAPAPGGRVALFGGRLRSGGLDLPPPAVFDANAGAWAYAPPMPEPIADVIVAPLANGQIAVVPRREFSEHASKTLQIFDADTGKSWDAAKIPDSLESLPLAGSLANGNLLLAPAGPIDFKDPPKAHTFDPRAGRWVGAFSTEDQGEFEIQPRRLIVSNWGLVKLGGYRRHIPFLDRINPLCSLPWATCGYKRGVPAPVTEVEVFSDEPLRRTFFRLEDPLPADFAATVAGDKIYAVGGTSPPYVFRQDGKHCATDVFEIDLAHKTQRRLHPLLQPLCRSEIVRLGRHCLLAIHGSYAVEAQAQLYDLTTDSWQALSIPEVASVFRWTDQSYYRVVPPVHAVTLDDGTVFSTVEDGRPSAARPYVALLRARSCD